MLSDPVWMLSLLPLNWLAGGVGITSLPTVSVYFMLVVSDGVPALPEYRSWQEYEAIIKKINASRHNERMSKDILEFCSI